MTGRLRPLAWATFGLTMAGMAGNGILVVVGRTLPAQISDWPTFVTVLLMIISFAIVGLLISLRFPGNAIGWICGGLALLLSIPAGAYGAYAFKFHPPPHGSRLRGAGRQPRVSSFPRSACFPGHPFSGWTAAVATLAAGRLGPRHQLYVVGCGICLCSGYPAEQLHVAAFTARAAGSGRILLSCRTRRRLAGHCSRTARRGRSPGPSPCPVARRGTPAAEVARGGRRLFRPGLACNDGCIGARSQRAVECHRERDSTGATWLFDRHRPGKLS